MGNFDKELLKWTEASKEAEEEANEMLRDRHRLGFTCIRVIACIVIGVILFKLDQISWEDSSSIFMKIILISGSIVFILGAIMDAYCYYDDENYLKGKGKREKVRVKTVLLHEVITTYSGGRYGGVNKYLKISYPMGDETIVRKLSDFNYDIEHLGYDLVGFYGKKITIAYCNKNFYILNHLYPEFDDEEMDGKEKIRSLQNSDITVRNLVEIKDEEQITKKKLKDEFMHQFDFKLIKYCLIMSIFADCAIGGLSLCIPEIHKSIYILFGGITAILSICCFMSWVSCKKHSGCIWDRKKLRKVNKELESEKKRY